MFFIKIYNDTESVQVFEWRQIGCFSIKSDNFRKVILWFYITKINRMLCTFKYIYTTGLQVIVCSSIFGLLLSIKCNIVNSMLYPLTHSCTYFL